MIGLMAVAGLVAGEAAHPEVPVVAASEPVIDLAQTVQELDADNLQADLVLREAVLPGEERRADLTLRFSRVDGAFSGGFAKSPDWNKARHQVAALEAFSFDGERMVAELDLSLQPDAWKPADKQPIPLRLRLSAQAEPITDAPAPASKAQVGRWWRIFPEGQGSRYRFAGTYTLTRPASEAEATGQVQGQLSLPVAAGVWNMGRKDPDGGVAFTFEMGTQRQNWNHARLAQLPLPQAGDWSDHDGLRLAVRTAAPRSDAGVTIWLREADGSWYYVKDAVSLAAERTEAVLLWEDFEEAEWVSPTNHMDEDFQLDRSAISHIGIGVVNPLGVGAVRFTLAELALVTCEQTPEEPAQATVESAWLAVNEHEVVPVGLFGGYAPFLPQRYRPGCQRVLHFAMTRHPRVPRQMAARFDADDFTDLPALLAALAAGGRDDAPAPARRIWELLGAEDRSKTIPGWIAAPPKNDKRAHKCAKRVAGMFNALLHRDDLYRAEDWSQQELDPAIAAALPRLAADELTTTEVMELNRRLLVAAFPAHLPALPAYGPTEQFIIDCQGERKFPATYLTRDDWEEHLREIGRAYARNARRAGHVPVMEFWNEPYLNWAERSRVNYNVKFYRTDLARPDGPVSVAREDGALDIIPHFKWVPARDEKVSQTDSGLMIIDESAFSYWSGRGNGYIYDRMYRAMAGGIKEVAPEAICVAGWGFRWHEDHWGAWDLLYRPTIDANIELIDGIHEHHYQGDPTDVTASYEVLTAYGVTAHDRWLRCYNTETNDLVDAPARGMVDVPADVAKDNINNYRRAIYNLRDILYCVAQVPDKAASRTVIHYDRTPQGSDVCYSLLANLRGRLLATTSDDPDVWCVAAIDGTDPAALPPEPGHTLVSILFNEHRQPRRVAVAVAAPTGTRFETARISRVVQDPQTGAVALAHETAQTAPERFTASVTIPGRSAWKVALPLGAPPQGLARVVRRQFFSPDLLAEVRPERPLKTAIELAAPRLEGASAARLRLVVADLAPGEGTAIVGDHALPLPKAYTRDNGNAIIELPLPLEALAQRTPVEFTIADPTAAGYRVNMASIVLETRE